MKAIHEQVHDLSSEASAMKRCLTTGNGVSVTQYKSGGGMFSRRITDRNRRLSLSRNETQLLVSDQKSNTVQSIYARVRACVSPKLHV